MGGDNGGDASRQNLEWGTLTQIVPFVFCHVSKFDAPDCSKHQNIGTKRSVLWPSKYANMHFWSWLRTPMKMLYDDTGLSGRITAYALGAVLQENIWGKTKS